MYDSSYETRAFEFNYAGTARHHLACTVCCADAAQQAAGAIVQAWPLCPRALRQPYPTSRMWRHVQVATSSMGGARKHAHAEVHVIGELGHGRSLEGLNVRQHLGGARKTHAVVSMTLTSFIIPCVATLCTNRSTAEHATHAASIWISARFVGVCCEHAVCRMTLSFMRYTIGGEEPRTPRPVP